MTMRLCKRKLCTLAGVLCLLSMLTITALATDTAVLRVEDSGVARGQTTTFAIYLDNPDDICGGNLELVYDNTAFTLDSIVAGGLLGGQAVTINTQYASNTAKVSFAGTTTLSGSEPLLYVTMTASATADLGETTLSLQNVRMYNSNIESVDVTTQDGVLTVQYGAVTVNSVESVSGQSVRVEFWLEGDLDAAGGRFEVTYDTSKLTAGSVVAGTILPNGTLLYGNENSNTIYVTWAGTEPVEDRGVLCTITFAVAEGATGTADININNLVMYDEEATAVASVATSGVITICEATETSPKLWVVGGQVDATTNLATVGIVLEGRGVVVGGGFTLTYPTTGCELKTVSTTDYTNTSVSVFNVETPGTLIFTWAGTSPDVDSRVLLLLEFEVDGALNGALTLDQASVLDSSTLDYITNVDIRSGKFIASGVALQAPIVDSAEVSISETNTSLSLTLDVASATQYSTDTSAVETIQLMMVFYSDGKMQTVTLDQREYTTTFDDNGVAQIEISASYAGVADEAKLFMVDGSGAWTPLSETIHYEL